MVKAALIAAAIVFIPATASGQETLVQRDAKPASMESVPAQAGRDKEQMVPLREAVAVALDEVAEACEDDIEEYCNRVTPGAGRLAQCMRAHDDQLSKGCVSALARVSGQLRLAINRVADGCRSEIQALCNGKGTIAQCVEEAKSSLSTSCRMVIGVGVRRAAGLIAQVGMPVFSADNKNLGQIVEITRGPDGSIQSIQLDVGRSLGIGPKLVAISVDKVKTSPGVQLQISEAEVRALPESKKQ